MTFQDAIVELVAALCEWADVDDDYYDSHRTMAAEWLATEGAALSAAVRAAVLEEAAQACEALDAAVPESGLYCGATADQCACELRAMAREGKG
jgi:hypothetical protein